MSYRSALRQVWIDFGSAIRVGNLNGFNAMMLVNKIGQASEGDRQTRKVLHNILKTL